MASPFIHINNSMFGQSEDGILIQMTDDIGRFVAKEKLVLGQHHQMKVKKPQKKHVIKAFWGEKYATFDAFRPDVDQQRSNIYFTADGNEIKKSYDHQNWENVANWSM